MTDAVPLARILVVDDEAAQMRALCDTLRDQGYETTGVTRGEDALKALHEQQFDLLLTDLMMPGMDGVALLTAALKIDAQLVGILMTGMGTIETAVQAMQAGALDYILKPFKLSAIVPVLSRALTVRRLRLDNLELRDTVAIHELNQALAYTVDPNVLLDKIADAALQQFDADEVSIMLPSADGRAFYVAAVRGEHRETLLGTRVAAGEGITGWVASRREPLVLQGEVTDPLLAPLRPRPEVQSALSMPMIARDRLVGVINVNCVHHRRAFTLGQIKVLSIFTNAAAASIEAARLYGELRESEKRLQFVLQSCQIGVWDLDLVDHTAYRSLEHDRIFGYTELLPQWTLDDFLRHALPEYRAEVETMVREGTAARRGWTYECPIRRADGEIRWIWFTGRHRTDLSGRSRVSGVVMDITERRHAEQEIRDLNASLERRVAERTLQLEEANRAKSDFLANMSHELRTPLNAIIGFSEMLKDGLLGPLEAKQQAFVLDIFDAGAHLLSLINDILDLSKVEAGMLQLEAGAVDLGALFQASTLIVREKALAHAIRLDTELDPGLGTVVADARLLKQIVYNLLSNAVKFTPDGGAVTLRARRCTRAEVVLEAGTPGRLLALPAGEDDEFLALTVEDSGVGIAEEDLAKLFEPFVQVDASSARRQAGTGLGLSLVRRLAELHGGTVGVTSRLGAGSRFCVWLPYQGVPSAFKPGKTAPMASAPAAPQVASGSPSALTRARRLALVIEPDDPMAERIAAQLRAEGFEVMRTATGEEGLVCAARSRPQLITLAIFLPAMDGWEFMRRLKDEPALAETPVVLITASADLEHGLALGARRVLHKPCTGEELRAAVAGLVGELPHGAPARVLVVDDNEKAVKLVAAALESEGHKVLCAYGGAEAIEMARSAAPDLMVLDLMMPEVSGFEVARALRDSEQTGRIPILVLTAKDLNADERGLLNHNVKTILMKSGFSSRDLLAEVRRALSKPGAD